MNALLPARKQIVALPVHTCVALRHWIHEFWTRDANFERCQNRQSHHCPSNFTHDSETRVQGRTVIFTDGACKRNAHADLRRAGSGGYWGSGHPANFCLPLPGEAQTNQRSELYALLKVLEREPHRAIEVRSDSRYVVDGFLRMSRWAGSLDGPVSNGDLWRRIANLISQNPQRVIVTWVKGHARWADVSTGRVNLFDKVGNAEADKLAVAGSNMHGALLLLEAEMLARKECFRRYHMSVLAILRERCHALNELPEHVTGPPVGMLARRTARRRLRQ